MKKRNVIKILILFRKNLYISAHLFFLEIAAFLLVFIINKLLVITTVINNSFQIALLFNGFIVPTILLIYNIKICKRLKIKLFLFSFLVLAITLILGFVILYAGILQLDRRLIFGYDQRQEVTGGLILYEVFVASCLYTIIGSVIGQILTLVNKRGI